MAEMSNAEIVEGCLRHDRRAMRALYDATAPMAMGVCMRYAASRDEAHDMLQDGYVKVYERIARLRKPESLRAWVYSVMANNAIATLRRSRRERLTDDVESLDQPLDIDPGMRHDLVVAMQQLNPRERLTFNLFTIEGYSIDEVARLTGASNIAVRVMLNRARNKMKKILVN